MGQFALHADFLLERRIELIVILAHRIDDGIDDGIERHPELIQPDLLFDARNDQLGVGSKFELANACGRSADGDAGDPRGRRARPPHHHP